MNIYSTLRHLNRPHFTATYSIHSLNIPNRSKSSSSAAPPPRLGTGGGARRHLRCIGSGIVVCAGARNVSRLTRSKKLMWPKPTQYWARRFGEIIISCVSMYLSTRISDLSQENHLWDQLTYLLGTSSPRYGHGI